MSGPAPLHCALTKCIQGALEWRMARVEVKTLATGATGGELAAMVVAWRPDGEACFHDICWKALVDSAKLDNPFTLSRREKLMVTEARRTAEWVDSEERLHAEATRFAHTLSTAQYAIAFTGAGISTAAGIPDFRGKNGKWTERERTKIAGVSADDAALHDDVHYSSVRPSYTHEALSKLVSLGRLRHVISQNTDGLHRLSGLPHDRLSDLHGNCFLEKCEKCGTRYERAYPVIDRHATPAAGTPAVGTPAVGTPAGGAPAGGTPAVGTPAVRTPAVGTPAIGTPPRICVHCSKDHRTGRKCELKGCDGFLMNTIINFGDSLESHVLRSAEDHAKTTDAVVCLGTTLRVKPACDLVEMGRRPLRLLICNRQPTRLDKLCVRLGPNGQLGGRVFADCDRLMAEVMNRMLGEEEMAVWQAERDERLRRYDSQREQP